MPSVRLPDGRIVHFPYDMTPQQIEAEVSKLAPAEAPTKKGGGLSDFLPAAGGVVGGLVGTAAGGPVGAAIGSGIGGAAGELGRQFIQGEDIDPASVAGTGLLEGATAGAIGGAMKHGGRLIRGVRSMMPSVSPELAKAGVDAMIDVIPGGKLAKTGMRTVARMMRTGGGEAVEAAAPEVGRRAPNIIPPSYLNRAADVPTSGLSRELRATAADSAASRYLSGDAQRQALIQELLRMESFRNLPTAIR